jgi:hypothetical protein
MVHVVNISNVLDEDTGVIGVVHVQVTSEAEGKALIAEFLSEEDADPADFAIVQAPDDWECVGHGDGPLCTKPRLN